MLELNEIWRFELQVRGLHKEMLDEDPLASCMQPHDGPTTTGTSHMPISHAR